MNELVLFKGLLAAGIPFVIVLSLGIYLEQRWLSFPRSHQTAKARQGLAQNGRSSVSGTGYTNSPHQSGTRSRRQPWQADAQGDQGMPENELPRQSVASAAVNAPDRLAGSPRPWQVMLTGHDGLDRISPELTADLGRILDLLPSVGHLRIQTADGSCIVTRDFPGYSRNEVDDILARAFQDNPGITSIQFPDGGSRAGHTATPDDPFESRYGRPAAEITAARTRGDITPEEAHRQLISLYSTSTEATQNELTGPGPTGAGPLDQLNVLKMRAGEGAEVLAMRVGGHRNAAAARQRINVLNPMIAVHPWMPRLYPRSCARSGVRNLRGSVASRRW